MKVFFNILTIYICFSSICFATDKFQWHNGKIIFEDNSEINGEISYNYRHGVIMLRDETGITKAYSAAQASYFEFFDDLMQVPRRYIALPFYSDANYASQMFFELIMEGEVAVFRKEKKNINLEFIQQHDNDNFTRYHASFDYYFFENGKFTSLKDFSKKMLPQMKKKYDIEISNFIEANELDTAIGVHAILIADFYNSLVDADYRNLQMVQSVTVE